MQKKHTKKHIWCAVMILLIAAFDRVTKHFAALYLSDGDTVDFLPGFIRFRYAENTGMAFSMLSGARWFFVVLTTVVCLGVLIWMFSNKCKSLWLYWSLGVVVAGGAGNLTDRALFGYVVDFIEPVFVDFAVFNIADCAVTCGSVSLVIYLLCDIIFGGKKNA